MTDSGKDLVAKSKRQAKNVEALVGETKNAAKNLEISTVEMADLLHEYSETLLLVRRFRTDNAALHAEVKRMSGSGGTGSVTTEGEAAMLRAELEEVKHERDSLTLELRKTREREIQQTVVSLKGSTAIGTDRTGTETLKNNYQDALDGYNLLLQAQEKTYNMLRDLIHQIEVTTDADKDLLSKASQMRGELST